MPAQVGCDIGIISLPVVCRSLCPTYFVGLIRQVTHVFLLTSLAEYSLNLKLQGSKLTSPLTILPRAKKYFPCGILYESINAVLLKFIPTKCVYYDDWSVHFYAGFQQYLIYTAVACYSLGMLPVLNQSLQKTDFFPAFSHLATFCDKCLHIFFFFFALLPFATVGRQGVHWLCS